MSQLCYIGLDAGTTGIKAIAFDMDGNILSSSYREYSLLIPHEGWSELDPQSMWRCAKEVLSDISQNVEIRVITVSSQGQAVAPFDRNGKPLYNFISTVDSRTVREYQWWCEHYSESDMYYRTGLAFSPIYTANKIMWMRDNIPEIFAKVWKFLCVEDYLTFRLSGETVIDYSLAGRGMMLDARNLCWDEDILNSIGINKTQLSTLAKASTLIGGILPSVAQELNLNQSVRIVVGGHDQFCGTIGCGVIDSCQTMDATGTVEVLVTIVPNFPPHNELMKYHYSCSPHLKDNSYSIMSINQNGGILLKWYKNTFCEAETKYAEQQGLDPYTHIIDQSSDNIANLYVLPHLNGIETPTLDPFSAGAIVRLRASHKKADITRAVLDSIAYDMRQQIIALETVCPKISEIRAIGGGAKHPKLLQIKADVTQKTIVSMAVNEAASLGAAILGATGVGDFDSITEAVSKFVKTDATFFPDPKKCDAYNCTFAEYLHLYPALKKFNHDVTQRIRNEGQFIQQS